MGIYKTCQQCKTKKSITEFKKHISTKDGYYHQCRVCLSLPRRLPMPADCIKLYSAEEISIIKARDLVSHLELNRAKHRAASKRRYQLNPIAKLRQNIRALIRSSLKNNGYSKNTKTYAILGCSFDEFKDYIENKFKDGMSWENYGKWEYDHITPVSWAINESEIIKLNHYTNLQPLWREENIAKSNKFSG